MADESSSEKRSTKLITDFVDGYAKNWRFTVRESFRDALDIVWTQRVSDKKDNNKKSIMQFTWTQGTNFRFKEGDILYDTRLAYELPWAEALHHIHLSIQVANTSDDSLRFKLYRPSPDFSRIELVDIFECTQREFVSFLKTGVLATEREQSCDLFNKFKKGALF